MNVPHSELDQLVLTINKGNSTVTNAVLFYRNALNTSTDPNEPQHIVPRLEVAYTNIQVDANLAPDAFSIAPYVEKKGKRYSPTGSCESYHLIHQTQP